MLLLLLLLCIGKSFPFESDIRVPFLVRGPGVGRGRVVQSLIGNVDLAPTFLEIAGVPVPPHMDGASIFRFFQKEKVKSRAPWRDTYLIERGKMPPAHFPKLNVVEDVPNNNEGTTCSAIIITTPPSHSTQTRLEFFSSSFIILFAECCCCWG